MKKMKLRKMMVLCLVCSLVTGLFTACGSSSEVTEEAATEVTTEGTTINILMEDVSDTEIVKNYVSAFEEETGITVNIETIGYSSMHEKLLTQMISATNTYDLIVVDCYWVGEFTTAGWLEDLDPYIEESGFDTSVYLDSMMEMVGEVDGTTYMIPFYNYMMALVYRTDVLEDNGIEMPANIEEYVELCKEMTEEDDDMYGVVMQGSRTDPIVVEWCNYLFSCGGDFYDADGNITINSEEAVHALDLYIDNITYAAPDGSKAFGFDEAYNVFAQGDAFSYITYNWMIPKLEDSEESAVSGLVDITAIPDGVSLNAGWGWGIPTNSSNKDAAWQFIEYIESAEVTKLRALDGGSPTRSDVMQDEEVLAAYPYLETVCEIMETSKMIPIMEDATQMVEVLGRELSLAVTGDKTSQEALDTVAEEMADMN